MGSELSPQNTFFLLQDGIITTTTSLIEWGQYMQKNDRQIFDHRVADLRISTVFLGLDHGYNKNLKPILFETMIFGGVFDQIYQTRCCLLSECSDMHYRAVDVAMRSLSYRGMSWRNIKKIASRRSNWMNEYLGWFQKELRQYYGKNKRCENKPLTLKKITQYTGILQ